MIEMALSEGHDVEISFDGVEVTQGFVDELLGSIVLRHGPDVANHVVFKGCSESACGILRFVLTDRAQQFALAADR